MKNPGGRMNRRKIYAKNREAIQKIKSSKINRVTVAIDYLE